MTALSTAEDILTLAPPDFETTGADAFLPDVWEYLIDKYSIQSVLDVGAGAGLSTKWFVDRGIFTLGIETWSAALENSQIRPNIFDHDYSAGPFIPSALRDLAWCAGAVDQIEEEFLPNLMASFRSCQYVCLTHTDPGDCHAPSANCQPSEYWIRKLNEFGFEHDAVETDCLRSTAIGKTSPVRQTLMFFKRRN